MRKLGGHLGGSRRIAVIASLAAVVAIAAAGTVLADPYGWFGGGNDNPWPYNSPGPAPVLAAVGDISCQPGHPAEAEKPTDTCDQGSGSTVRDAAQNATAEQVEAIKPALVAVLGDEQYQNGYYTDFESSFDKYWGALKFLQRPSPGNHEFYDNHGQTGVRGLGYFDYYNGLEHNANGSEVDDTVTNPTTGVVLSQPAPQQEGQAGQFGQTGNGWYSYDLGAWHLISLNIECADEPGGCSPTGSWFASETKWLAQDLNADHTPVHARVLASADVQLDREPVHLGQHRGADGRHVVEAPLCPPRDADPQRARPRLFALRADGSGRQLRPAARNPRVHHRDGRRVARHGDPEHAEPPGVDGPVLRRDEAQAAARRLHLGLRVGDGEPDRPGRDAADLQRQGRRHLQRAARLLKTAAWGRHPPAPHAYPTGGNRGGGDR